MFRTITEIKATVSIEFDGEIFEVPSGISVAAALLSNGVSCFRSSVVSGEPRAPYCMMGVCFECLVMIDGVQNRQSCLTEVREGMVIGSQKGPRTIGATT